MLPLTGTDNFYSIQSVDFSGNTSELSGKVTARVRAVPGASFSDLILPMPIHKALSSDLWGAENVIPRDPDKGVESPDWSYWGGKIIKDKKDGKYHILIARWPEGARKGHWQWQFSTVAHVVSDSPTGPYMVKDETAYSFENGMGHNPNITVLNDGRYMLHLWKGHVFTSDTMNGPWNYEGKLTVEYDKTEPGDPKEYQYYANLSGVQEKDGSILMVSKFGRMMRSTAGLLGPYQVLTQDVHHNGTIPEQYRKSNYEDPTMWRDEVQYHMLINAFLDYRAIYLRSPDGIHWKYETGLAYTPNSTIYEDSTRTFWYKLERPNVLTDEFGRATHLSLAGIDVPKEEDYGNDKHSAKHLIMPLVVYKRVQILNEKPITPDTESVRILLRSEAGFDAAADTDLNSLRFGAPEAVNFGRGCKVLKTESHADGLMIKFKGAGNEINGSNFTAKLIGKCKDGSLLVAYAKLPGE